MNNFTTIKRLQTRYQNAQRKRTKQQQSGKHRLPRIPIKSAVIYDAKRDMVAIVEGMRDPNCPMYILNYRDARCAVWDIAKDIKDRASCRAFGEYCSPPKPARPGPGDFWIDAAQYALEGLALSFALNAEGRWDFRDILVATRSKTRLLKILASDLRTEEYLELLGGEGGERLTHAVLVTVQVYLSLFAPIAAAWYYKRQWAKKTDRKIQTYAFTDMPHKAGIYLLGRDVENLVGITAMNRLFLTIMGRVLLNQEADDLDRQPQHFFVLDEFHTLGFLPEFEEFATNGSGKGVSIALAMQAYPSLQRLYGKEGAEVICGQIFRKAYLRLNDSATAEFASKDMGTGDRFLKSYTGSWQLTYKLQRDYPVVRAAELGRIPPPAPGKSGFLNRILLRNGQPLKGFYKGLFGFCRRIPSSYISKNLLPKADVPKVLPWEVPLLPTWDYDDIKRLNLEGVIDEADFAEQRQEEEVLARQTQTNSAKLDAIKFRLEDAYSNPKFIGEKLPDNQG